jgi:hypothetical protein
MSVRALNPMPSHTLTLVIDHIRVPFQPKHDPCKKLAEEIEVSSHLKMAFRSLFTRDIYGPSMICNEPSLFSTSSILSQLLFQSCKRKIWECIDPADRQRYLEKKQKKIQFGQVNRKENMLGCIVAPVEPICEVHREPAKLQMQTTNSNRSNLEFQVNAMKVADLKKELKELGFDTGGLKKDLRSRLLQAKLDTVDSSTNRTAPAAPKKDVEHSNFGSKPSTNSPFFPVDSFENNDNDIKRDGTVDVDSCNVKVPLVPDVIVEKSHKDSISSMQVEHHMTEISEVHRPDAPQVSNHESESWKDQNRLLLKESKSPHPTVELKSSKAATTIASNNTASLIGKEARVSDEEMPPANPTDSAKSQFEQTEAFFSTTVGTVSEDGQGISRPVSEASSATSKSSGKMVKDMVSKFSGLTSISSTSSSNGSALSKGLQAKKDARLARMAEIREKVRQTRDKSDNRIDSSLLCSHIHFLTLFAEQAGHDYQACLDFKGVHIDIVIVDSYCYCCCYCEYEEEHPHNPNEGESSSSGGHVDEEGECFCDIEASLAISSQTSPTDDSC